MTISQFISENYYTVSEVASLLGVSKVSAQLRIHKGHFPIERVGRVMLIPKQSFSSYVEAKKALNEPLRRKLGDKKIKVDKVIQNEN
jgi:excisionase family DNA binding protein